MENSLNLFDEMETHVRYLNIVFNDKKFDGDFKELVENFEELRAVTFVSSPKAFFDLTKNFKKVILIIGIEDNDILNNLDKQINPDSTADFFKQLDKDTLEKIAKSEIEIRYARIGQMIHSKIFILSKGNRKRVMVGSANLTGSALSNKKQFEELIVYDQDYNSSLFKIFEDRFEEIYEQTLDYVPERLKKSKEPMTVNLVTANGKFEILSDMIKKQEAFVISSDALKELTPVLDEEKINLDIKNRKFKTIKEIFHKITRKSKERVVLISPNELAKRKPIFMDTFNQSSKAKETEAKVGIKCGTDNLLYRTDGYLYSKKIDDTKKIAFFLDKLERFIDAYKIFTIGSKEEKIFTQQRVFEAILYTFVSPYIWKLREIHIEEKGSKSVRADIPIFLVIAGRSYTGKTHLLEFLSVLTNQRLFTFEAPIKPSDIRNYFYSGEVFPLLIDEMKKQYFSSGSDFSTKGEGFIKELSNTLDNTHPCVISTLNANFDANSQIIRRIYYLEMKITFDKKRREEMDSYYSETVKGLNDELLKDFSWRMAHKLDGELLIKYDALRIGREIFKDYFLQTKKTIPRWFNKEMLNDYTLKSKNIWKTLFETRKNGFKVKGNDILVDMKTIFTDHFEQMNAKNYLDPSIVKEDSVVLVLDKRRFFEFIDHKEGLIDKLKKIAKNRNS